MYSVFKIDARKYFFLLNIPVEIGFRAIIKDSHPLAVISFTKVVNPVCRNNERRREKYNMLAMLHFT